MQGALAAAALHGPPLPLTLARPHDVIAPMRGRRYGKHRMEAEMKTLFGDNMVRPPAHPPTS